MRKGARGESKKAKERKIIEIKQSKQISPVKEVIEPDEARYLPRTQKRRDSIPNLKKNEKELTQEEIASFNTHSNQLICVQLMKTFIKKQQPQLQQFLNFCPPIMSKAFGIAINLVENSYNTIRQERIERMKQQTIIFVPPDKDYFQKQKGKTLNNWIKQNIKVNENKQNFPAIVQENSAIIRGIEQQIKRLSIEIPKENVQPQLESIVNSVNIQNQNEVHNKLQATKNDFLQVIGATDEMRKIHLQAYEIKMQTQFNKIQQVHRFQNQRNPSHTMALFSIEDYFV